MRTPPRGSGRMAVRAHQVRRARRWRRVLIVLVIAGLPASSAALIYSPWFAVDTVALRGNRRMAPADVLATARVPRGGPLLFADLAAVRRRLLALPGVDTVSVRRVWPHTVEIRIAERVAALGVPRADGIDLYDAAGRLIDRLDAGVVAPGSLPLLRDTGTQLATPDLVRAAVAAIRSLSAPLRAEIAALSGSPAGDLLLRLRDGAIVVWGDADRSPDKAGALGLLIGRRARRYDLRAPDTPALR